MVSTSSILSRRASDVLGIAFGTRYTTNSTDDAEHNVPVAKSARFSMGWSRVDVDVLPNAGNWTASKPFVRGPAVHTFVSYTILSSSRFLN